MEGNRGRGCQLDSNCGPERHKTQEVGQLVGGRTVGRAGKPVLFTRFGRRGRIKQTESSSRGGEAWVRLLKTGPSPRTSISYATLGKLFV